MSGAAPAAPARGAGASARLILLGLVVGAVAGIAVNAAAGPDAPWVRVLAHDVAAKVGEVFLRLLFMIVIPIVFSSLTLGVAGLGAARGFGRVGAKTLLWFVATTGCAALLGVVLVDWIRPGAAVGAEVAARLAAAGAGEARQKIELAAGGTGFGVQTFVNIIPKNPLKAAADGDMLGLIFFSLMLGAALGALPKATAKPLLDVLQALYDASARVIGYAMRIAPLGVAGLIFEKTALFGASILHSLAWYVGTALLGLAIQQFLVLGVAVRLFGGMSPRQFFRRCRVLMATAFSTSSSNATLPTTIRTAREELGVPADIAGFVLPLGATLNMNGTALFEGVAVLFLAQLSGVPLSFGAQLVVVTLAILTAIGTSGVPGGSLPLLALVLQQVGVDPSMLAVILGVDRLIDMARTVPNVTGDAAAALVVAKSEGRLSAPEPR